MTEGLRRDEEEQGDHEIAGYLGVAEYALFYFLFAVLGLEALRRLTAREFPDSRAAPPPADASLDDAAFAAAEARVLEP